MADSDQHKIKLTPFPAGSISPARKPLYGQTDHVDQYGNLWVRVAAGTVGQVPETTGVDNTVEGSLMAGLDPGGLVQLFRVGQAGYPLDPSEAKLDAILAALNKILFVLSTTFDVEPEDALESTDLVA